MGGKADHKKYRMSERGKKTAKLREQVRGSTRRGKVRSVEGRQLREEMAGVNLRTEMIRLRTDEGMTKRQWRRTMRDVHGKTIVFFPAGDGGENCLKDHTPAAAFHNLGYWENDKPGGCRVYK